MSEANNNHVSFSSESNPESFSNNNQHQQELENQDRVTNEISSATESQPPNSTDTELQMNWQKVAHKLREYNRKLIKKVFRLEQELAEIDNKYNKYIEQSQNSDILVAQQEAELKNYQKQVALLTQHLTVSEQELNNKETQIAELSQQYRASQQQAAQLERDCTLLQESYSQKNYELITKDKENKDLQTKLNQQQRSALQYKAELKRYQEKANVASQESLTSDRTNYSPARSIKPWSTNTSEPKIALPKTKVQATPVSFITNKSPQTIKTAAQISTWSSSVAKEKQKNNANNKKSAVGGKPKSLAAVDLPTFPRPL